MDEANPTRRRVMTQARPLGLAAALAIHSVLLVALVLDLRLAREADQEMTPPYTVDIELVPFWRYQTVPRGAARGETEPGAPSRARAPGGETRPTGAPAAAQGQEGLSPPPAAAHDNPKVAGDSEVARTAATLRAALGCRHGELLGLTREEQERCGDRLGGSGAEIADAPLALPPGARAEFDLAWKENHSPQHMAAMGCFAKFGLGKVRWYHPSRGVKLGPLPCYVVTPKATLLPDKTQRKGF